MSNSALLLISVVVVAAVGALLVWLSVWWPERQRRLRLLRAHQPPPPPEPHSLVRDEYAKLARELNTRRVVCDEQIEIIADLRRELAGSRLAHSASMGVQRQLAAALVALDDGYAPLTDADRLVYEELWRGVCEHFAAAEYVLEHPEEYRAHDRTA